MNSYSLEHALQQIKDLKDKGLPEIFEINQGHRRAYTFGSYDNCLAIYDNMGNIMSIDEMQKLFNYLEFSIENLDESKVIKENIKILEDEVIEWQKPKKATIKNTNSEGYVYLLKGGNGKYKIGASKNPVQRCKSLRLASSENHELIHFFKCVHMFKMEKSLHAIFKSKKSHSEWFDLDENEVSHIKGIKDEI